jgi:4-amino-4-deoxy-L-arabinose transferase-like glycosyltransferase
VTVPASIKHIGIVFCFALVIRIAAFVFLGSANRDFGDAEAYRNLGQNLAAGRGFQISIQVEGSGLDFWHEPPGSWYIVGRTNEPTAFYEPVFPLLLAGFYSVFGSAGDTAYLAFQILFGSWLCVLVYHLARRIASENASLAAGLFCGIYPSFVFYSVVLMTDMLFFFFLLLCLLQGFRYMAKPNLPNLILLAVLFALTAMTRSVAIVAAPIIFISLLLTGKRWKDKIAQALLFAVCLSVFFGAWMYRNFHIYHAPIILPTKGAYNYWDTMACLPRLLGDHGLMPRSRKPMDLNWDLQKVERALPELNRLDLLWLPDQWAATEPGRAKQLTRQTTAFLMANPSYAVKRYLRVAAKMYLPFRIETNSRALQWGQGITYLLALLAGVWGWIQRRRDHAMLNVIAISLLIYGLIVPIYSIQNSQRSRMPLDIMLIWLAAYSFQAIYDRLLVRKAV